jgi:hypothetical protein
MWESIPESIKIAVAIVATVSGAGAATYALTQNASVAHDTAFANEARIEVLSDTVSAVYSEVRTIRRTQTYSTCLLQLQLTDSVFTPLQVDARCPR